VHLLLPQHQHEHYQQQQQPAQHQLHPLLQHPQQQRD
jgi:hypothetical protein